MDERFTLGHIGKGSNLKLLGCDVAKCPIGDIKLSMAGFLDRISPIDVSKMRRNNLSAEANKAKIHSYRSLTGTLLYIGQAALPKACLAASKMRQELGSLRVSDSLEANSMVREVLKLKPVILYPKVNEAKSVGIVSFSDASHEGIREVYGQ